MRSRAVFSGISRTKTSSGDGTERTAAAWSDAFPFAGKKAAVQRCEVEETARQCPADPVSRSRGPSFPTPPHHIEQAGQEGHGGRPIPESDPGERSGEDRPRTRSAPFPSGTAKRIPVPAFPPVHVREDRTDGEEHICMYSRMLERVFRRCVILVRRAVHPAPEPSVRFLAPIIYTTSRDFLAPGSAGSNKARGERLPPS